MSLLRSSARVLSTPRAQLQILTGRTATSALAQQQQQQQRTISSTPVRSAEHAHDSHFDPPGGWLFGVKPGEKYEKEGWENIFYIGFFGSLLVGVVGYAYKPDSSIQTWALEEARRRLEAEGILEDPDKKR